MPVVGETDLACLLSSLSPQLQPGEFVFCTVMGASYGEYARLSPLASFLEAEGLSLVLPRVQADAASFSYERVFSCISLSVHSSLEAVGLTAAVCGALADRGISANVIAATFHDHVLVLCEHAAEAVRVLERLGGQ